MAQTIHQLAADAVIKLPAGDATMNLALAKLCYFQDALSSLADRLKPPVTDEDHALVAAVEFALAGVLRAGRLMIITAAAQANSTPIH